ncbi:hypothetical protein ACFZAR_35675 [Streptomyces sp. NPDC008222]|uniref:hypothetical protein n=1 Tax=Streptomyces sp. NPDC008222 TaxID=3364820 RepID=UPI0036F1907A
MLGSFQGLCPLRIAIVTSAAVFQLANLPSLLTVVGRDSGNFLRSLLSGLRYSLGVNIASIGQRIV